MASGDTMMIVHEDVHDNMDYDDDHHQQHHHRSRLSMCNGPFCDDDMMFNMSRLSVEDGSEVDADGEQSDGKEQTTPIQLDDSDRETGTGWFSLPASPLERRGRRGCGGRKEYGSENESCLPASPLERRGRRGCGGRKEYGSENESCRTRRTTRSSSMNMMMLRERRLEKAWEMKKSSAAIEDHNPRGESESCNVVMARRPKRGGGGGKKSLCMDRDEIRACRDLGFDLKGEWSLEIPISISNSNGSRISGSTVDTDTGGNSPIASWRISSPGDDPRDVKARIKVWAQAVALASASHLNG